MNSAVTAVPGSSVVIEPATWRDLNALRHLEKVCFPLDAWPLWDLVGVLTLPNVVRLKAMVAPPDVKELEVESADAIDQ